MKNDIAIDSKSNDCDSEARKDHRESAHPSTHTSSSFSRGAEGALADAAASHSLVVAGLVPQVAMLQNLLRFRAVLDSLFSPSSASYQEKTLKNLCASWRVHSHGKNLDSHVARDIMLVKLASRVAETPAVLATIRTIGHDGEGGAESATNNGSLGAPCENQKSPSVQSDLLT